MKLTVARSTEFGFVFFGTVCIIGSLVVLFKLGIFLKNYFHRQCDQVVCTKDIYMISHFYITKSFPEWIHVSLYKKNITIVSIDM